MSTEYGTTLSCLDDLPKIGAMVSGPTAAAYRCARRLLQTTGGLMDVIEVEEGNDYPEASFISLDIREYLGRDMDASDLDDLSSLAASAIKEETSVDEATVDVTLSAGTLSLTIEAVGAEGPFSFVLSVSDVTSAILRTL